MRCLFATDLHGRASRYRKLWKAMGDAGPDAVFLGGDLLPGLQLDDEPGEADFIRGFLAGGFQEVRDRLGDRYPGVFLILGNDDPRAAEPAFQQVAARGLWSWCHGRRLELPPFEVYGYSHIPPSPFLLKDWERYDVSRYVPPGAVSPEEGHRSVPVPENEIRYGTIKADLEKLAGDRDLERAVFILHSPPHETALDRAALDGMKIEHVPLDVHVGSIAIRKFIERRQPLLTLHGHIHESAKLTGSWRDRIGRTHIFGGAHDGDELALVRFDLMDLDAAERVLL